MLEADPVKPGMAQSQRLLGPQPIQHRVCLEAASETQDESRTRLKALFPDTLEVPALEVALRPIAEDHPQLQYDSPGVLIPHRTDSML